ncbi:MAG: cyclic lactone autoinducer peptide [Candidatus Limiplasma sp.]|nr:cyclic lactone autoinducer peptide [Candidatus Limiplasma sp.]
MKKFYGLVAAISTVVAAMIASSACFLFLYQPEEPASLRNE